MAEEPTIDEKYKSATKLLLETRDEVEQLETGQNTSVFIEGRISVNLNNLSRLIDQLQTIIVQQPINKRDLWKIRIKQLNNECKSLRESLEAFLNERYKRRKLEEEREKLLERRAVKSSVGVGGSNENENRFSNLVNESESLNRSVTIARDVEDAGYSILGGIGHQNEQIKTIQKKVYDIGITLGLSKSVMKVIERKQFVDKLLVYGGMLVTLAILFLLWYYLR